jgi:hypothetical protein
MITWYGWIPILTSSLQFDYFHGGITNSLSPADRAKNEIVLIPEEANTSAKFVFDEKNKRRLREKLSA